MASATVGVLRVLLTANGSEFEAAMKKAQGAAQAWSKDLESIGRQATALGSSLTRTVSLPIVAALGGAAKAAMDFESDFANVAKTVDGVSDAAGKLTPKGQALAMTFRQMAKEIPATTSELTAIAALGGQMGVPIDQLEHFTKNVAALGVAIDGISTEEAAAGLAQIGNATGQGTVNVDKMASALVHLGNNSAATESDILEFSKRLAGAGHSAGMTIPEIMAIGTAMANVGIKAEAGGTAMSVMIMKMSMAVAEGGSKLKAFDEIVRHTGQSFTELWKGSPSEAVNAVVVGLGKARDSGVDLNLAVRDIGATNIRTASTMKLLAGAGDGVATSLTIANEGWSTGNKHLEEAQKKYATTANQLKLLWNNITDVGITLGNALLPAIRSSIQLVGALVPVIDTLAKGFAALPGGVQLVALGLAGVVASAGPVLWIFGQLITSTSLVIGAFGKKGLATKLLAADLGILSKASAGATASLGLLAKAAGVAAAAFVGWQIGRLIADLTGLDEKIARLVTHASALEGVRKQVAGGGESGRTAVTDALAQKERELTKAVQDGNRALVARVSAEIEAIKSDQTRLAIQDTINKAIKAGADQNITYAQAVEFNAQKAKEHASSLTQQTAAQEQSNAVNQKRVTIAEAVAAQESAARKDIEATGYTMAQLLTELKKNEDGFKGWAKQVGLSSETVAFLESKLKGNAKAHQEFVKEQTAAEKAAEALNKRLEKQADALEKLGIVTENQVLKALGEFNELIELATDAGVPLDKVLIAILPRMEDLAQKAKDSGVHIGVFGDTLDKARAAAQKLADDGLRRIQSSLPPIISGLRELPGTVLELNKVVGVAGITAQNTADSFKFFGIKTRDELRQTALDAVAHYEEIKRSGVATPEAIQEAFEKMNVALRAAGMDMKNDWRGFFEGMVDDIARSFDGIVGAIASGLGRVMDTYRRIQQGMSRSQGAGMAISSGFDLWNSTGQEGQSTTQSTISGVTGGMSTGALVGTYIMPGIGTLGGMVIGGVIGGVIGYFKGRDANNQHKKANDARDEFLSQYGPSGTGQGSGFSNFAKEMHTLGPIGDAIFQRVINAKTVQEFEAAIQQAEAAMGEFRGEMSRLAQEGGVAGIAMMRFRDRTRETAETLAFIRSESITAANSIGAFLKTSNFSSQASATAGSDLIAASFAEMRAQGMSTRQILAELGPTITLTQQKLAEAGFTGGEAFNDIARFASIASDEVAGPLLDGIGHLTRGLEAAHNAGLLTQSMFAGLTGEIMKQRQALIDLGHSEEDVNRLMQRDLQTLWQLRKDYNYEVDEGTGLLLDQAEAAGIVGDKYRSAMDRAAIAMEKAANAILKAFGIAGDAAEDFGKKVDLATRARTVRIDYSTGDVPEPSLTRREAETGEGGGVLRPNYAARGALVTTSGLRHYFASGGPVPPPRGADTVLARLSPGELIMNEAQQGVIAAGLRQAAQVVSDLFHAPAAMLDRVGGAVGGLSNAPMMSTVILEIDRREFGRGVAPVLPGEARRLGVRVRT